MPLLFPLPLLPFSLCSHFRPFPERSATRLPGLKQPAEDSGIENRRWGQCSLGWHRILGAHWLQAKDCFLKAAPPCQSLPYIPSPCDRHACRHHRHDPRQDTPHWSLPRHSRRPPRRLRHYVINHVRPYALHNQPFGVVVAGVPLMGCRHARSVLLTAMPPCLFADSLSHVLFVCLPGFSMRSNIPLELQIV